MSESHGILVSFVAPGMIELARPPVAHIPAMDPKKDCPGEKPSMPPAITSGPSKLFITIAREWTLNNDQILILLGARKGEDPNRILDGDLNDKLVDLRDRISAVIKIYLTITGLYRSPDSVQEWLNEKQELLGQCSPLELMLEGSLEKLLKVRQYAEYLSHC